MSEYTPTMENISDCYARYGNETTRTAEFNRAIAAHDKALREQIADDLQTEADNLDLEVPNAHREGIRDGLMRGVDIARGEDQTDE